MTSKQDYNKNGFCTAQIIEEPFCTHFEQDKNLRSLENKRTGKGINAILRWTLLRTFLTRNTGVMNRCGLLFFT
jgi:hypothetical protein